MNQILETYHSGATSVTMLISHGLILCSCTLFKGGWVLAVTLPNANTFETGKELIWLVVSTFQPI